MAELSEALSFPRPAGATAKTNRNVAIDYLRLLMTFGVVVTHANFLCGTQSMACLATIHGSFRLGVPVFLLISGYFFFEALKGQNHWTWVRQLARLYAVWMIIYSPFWLIEPIRQNDLSNIPEHIVFGYFHLWYVAAVGGAAVVTILLARLGVGWLALAALLLFGCGVGIQYALNYGVLPDRLFHHAFRGWLHRNFLFFGFPFFVIGFILAATKIETKVSRNLALGVFAAGLALLAVEVGSNYAAAGEILRFEIYAAVIVGAPALLIAALKTKWHGGHRHLPKFAEAIFFVHILVLNALLFLGSTDPNQLAVLCLAITLPLAAGLVWLDQRVKGVFL